MASRPFPSAQRADPAAGGPLVSIVVPMLNEERYISGCLDSILAGTFPLEQCEVLVVDGGSVDNSREIVRARLEQYPSLRLLDNPRRIQGRR